MSMLSTDWLLVYRNQAAIDPAFDTVFFDRVSSLITAIGMRAAAITMTTLNLTKAVTFSSPMPNANYRITFGAGVNLGTAVWATSKTASGFTVNVAVGISATVDYIAVQDL